MRFNVASILTGVGFVLLLCLGELTYITVRMNMRGVALGGSLASLLVHPRNLLLSTVAFVVGVFIANRLGH
jgi:hypothetical protein